ncbi:MAG: CPBP family intramembrane metalloprotease [Bacteroidaceae bacterium]|nr:CPBP family intramembrane metalloprotease [Bacteroidaceae bacterium]
MSQLLSQVGAMVIAKLIPSLPTTPGMNVNVLVLGYLMLILNLMLLWLLPKFKLTRYDWFASWSTQRFKMFAPVIGATLLLALGTSLLVQPFDLDDGGSTLLFHAMKGDILCVILLVFVGPLLEEVIFREGLLRQLIVRYHLNPILSIVLSALAFGFVHANFLQAIPAILMGILLGGFYLLTGDIRLSYAAHVSNNACALLLLYLPQFDVMEANWPMPIALGIGALLSAGSFMWLKKLLLQK